MAFPQVASSTNGVVSDGVNVTSHPTTLPATINSGDLLIGIWAHDNNTGGTWDQSSAGTWTQLEDTTNGTALRLLIFAKVADGTEDGATLTHTTGTAQQSSYIYLRITGWAGTISDVEAGTAATGTSANPDPPSITPSWGSDDNLIIAVYGADGNGSTSVYPYADNNIANDPVSSGSAATGVCTDELTASPVNPGTYTIQASQEWITQTLAVKPAGGVAPQAYYYRYNL